MTPAKQAQRGPAPTSGTIRRLLAFVNAAKRPEDLTDPPANVVRFHPEGLPRRRPDFHEPHEEPKRKPVLDLELANRILETREKISPVYGFLSLEQLLEIEGVRRIFDDWVQLFGPAIWGAWELRSIPCTYLIPIHAALLRPRGTPPRAHVLFIPQGTTTYLWDPEETDPALAFTGPGNQPTNPATATTPETTDSLFCTGHAFLTDGRLLCTGGGGDGTGPIHNHGWKFDPVTLQWSRTAGDMAAIRWYPTLVTLGDEPGRVLVVSGFPSQIEVYLEETDTFVPVYGPGGVGDTSVNRAYSQLYPGLHWLPTGQVLYVPVGWAAGGALPGNTPPYDWPSARPSEMFDLLTTSPPVTGTWMTLGTVDAAAAETLDRVKGMSVLLLRPTPPFVRALVVGGGANTGGTVGGLPYLPSTRTYQVIDLSSPTPVWGPAIDLPDGLDRVNVNLVLLPDGTVFMAGGRPLGATPPNGGSCWVFDPDASPPAWYPMEHLSYARQYHSMALLLPSARVMVAGWSDKSIEIFSPPYLYRGTRPSITAAPDLVHHGQSFGIDTPDPTSVAKVVLVRPAAVTHQTDSEQRVIQLAFAVSGPTAITATMPDGVHPHAAPRGYYMLFLLNTAGVPSIAKFIYLH